MSYCDYTDATALRNSCQFLHNITRDLRMRWALHPMEISRFPSSLYAFVKYARVTEGYSVLQHMGGELLDTFGHPFCKRYLSLACEDKFCHRSHSGLDLDFDLISNADGFLEYSDYFVVVNEAFGAHFVWQYELFLEELFHCYAVTRDVVRRKVNREVFCLHLRPMCSPIEC